jgi:pyruvate,water dikinase
MRTHLAVTFLSTVFYALLDSYLKKSISLDIETSRLLSSGTGMRSAQLGRDLSELAKLLQAQPGLLECLQSSKGIRLEDCLDQTPEAMEFNTSFHEFLRLHGHASMEEYELAAPRWREEPGYVLTLILSILRAPNKTRETSLPSKDQAESHDGIFRVRKSLGLRPQRFFFEILLFWTRLYSISRENLKYHFVLAYGQLREIYLLVAQSMEERRMLADHDDLFFLTHEQLGLCINGENGEKMVEEFVELNREIYTQQKSIETDSRIEQSRIFEEREDGSIHPIHVRAAEENSGFSTRKVLSGVPASAGHIIGQARVISDSLDLGVIRSGEIIVTHSTNPAWAPLLLNAGGLVTNVGGLLSHGAILAREYGLPAVLNVRGATELITSGEWIEIDGGRGTVNILSI